MSWITDKKTGAPGPRVGSNGAAHTLMGALDSTGAFFALDSCQQTITKNASGQVTQIDATDGVSTWRQTVTYTATTVVTSLWVKQ